MLKNVWFDTAASPYLYRPEVYRFAAEIAGMDKILFGSDFPLIRASRYFKDLHAAGLNEQAVSLICGGSARGLLA